MRSRVAVLVTFAAAVSAFAQQQPPPPTYGETLEVRIINVDVVVTTRDGKPVTGLSKDAFELTADGKKRDISNFLEITPAPAAEPAQAATEDQVRDVRTRKIVFFVDNASIRGGNRNRVLDQLQRLLSDGLRPGDAVMLATWNGHSVGVPLQLTTDHAAAQTAYANLAKDGALGTAFDADRQQAFQNLANVIRFYSARGEKPSYEMGIGEVRGFASRAMTEMRFKVEAIKGVINAMRGLDGRKAFVLLTENVGANPAYSAFEFFDQIKDQFDGGETKNPLNDAREFEIPQVIDSIAEAANSAGVSLYAVHTGGTSADQLMSDPSDSSLRSLLPRGGLSLGLDLGTLQTLASATGGAALVGANDFSQLTSTILNDLDSYYSLGYRANGPDQDRVTTVGVRLKSNPNKYVVRTRRTIVETSSGSALRDTVVANLFYPIAKNDLRVAIAAGNATPVGDGKHVTVPLMITIPMDTLTLMPEGAEVSGHFSVVGSFLRKDGVVSKVDRTQQSFHFPADSVKNRKELKLKLNLMAELGTEGVSIGIMDDISKATGFASTKLAQQ